MHVEESSRNYFTSFEAGFEIMIRDSNFFKYLFVSFSFQSLVLWFSTLFKNILLLEEFICNRIKTIQLQTFW